MTRPDSFDLVYLDSSVFIRYMRRDRGWEVVDRLLYAAEARQFELLTSPLLLVECLGQQPSSTYDAGIEARTLDHLDNPRLIPADFTRSTALRARNFTSPVQLKAPATLFTWRVRSNTKLTCS